MLHFDFTMKPGVVAERALDVVIQHIRELAKNGPTEDEMVRAKAKLEGDFQRQRLSAGGLAQSLGLFQATLGEHTLLETVVPKMKATTIEDVKQAALECLQTDRFTQLIVRCGEGEDR